MRQDSRAVDLVHVVNLLLIRLLLRMSIDPEHRDWKAKFAAMASAFGERSLSSIPREQFLARPCLHRALLSA